MRALTFRFDVPVLTNSTSSSLDQSTTLIALEADQVFSLDNAAGMLISPQAARLWLTEEGDPVDHVVNPGEDYLVARDGRTLIQSLGSTKVELTRILR